MSSNKVPFLGCKISLISRSEIRYEGILYTVDVNESTLALAKVVSMGTEDRPTDKPVPQRSDVYEYIIFRASDIKDVRVCEPPKSQGGLLDHDPAIVKVSKHSESGSHHVPPAPVQRTSSGHFPMTFQGLAPGAYSRNASVPLFDALGVGSGSPRGRAENRRGRFRASRAQGDGDRRSDGERDRREGERRGDGERHSETQFPFPSRASPARQSRMNAQQYMRFGSQRRRTSSQQSQNDSRSQERQPQQHQPARPSRSAPDYVDLDASSPDPVRSPQQTQSGRKPRPGRRRRTRSQTEDAQAFFGRQMRAVDDRALNNVPRDYMIPIEVARDLQDRRDHPDDGQRGRGRGGRFRGVGRGGRGRWGGGWNNWNWNNWNRGGWFFHPRGGGRGRRNTTRQDPPEDLTVYETDFDFEGAEQEFRKLFQALKKDGAKVELSAELLQPREEGELSPSPSKKFYEKSKFFDEISCEAQERAQGVPVERKDWRIERKLNSETFGEAMANRAGRSFMRGRGGFYGNRRGGYQRRGYNPWHRSTGIPVPSRRRASTPEDPAREKGAEGGPKSPAKNKATSTADVLASTDDVPLPPRNSVADGITDALASLSVELETK